MNTLDVTKFGVQELDHKEMVEIEGGGWLGDAWDATVSGLQRAYNWLKGRGVKLGTDAEDFA